MSKIKENIEKKTHKKTTTKNIQLIVFNFYIFIKLHGQIQDASDDDSSDNNDEVEEEKPENDTDDIKIEEIRNETSRKLNIADKVNKETKLNKKGTKVKRKGKESNDSGGGKVEEEKKTSGPDEYEEDSSDEEVCWLKALFSMCLMPIKHLYCIVLIFIFYLFQVLSLARLHKVHRAIAVTPVVHVPVPVRVRVPVRVTLALKFSRSLYLDNHSSESIHTWTIDTL